MQQLNKKWHLCGVINKAKITALLLLKVDFQWLVPLFLYNRHRFENCGVKNNI